MVLTSCFVRKLTRKIIIIANFLVAVLLLLSYTAPFINPAKILLPAFLGLAYPYLLLANFIFFIYFTIRLRRELLISLAAILIGWGHLMNFIPMNFAARNEQHDTEQKEEFRVMSYNVRTFDQFNWSNEEDYIEGIYQLIADESPDILCIQEFYTVNRPGMRESDVRRSLSDHPHFSIYYSLRNQTGGDFGIATFSKYPIIKTSRIPFDNSLNHAVYTDINLGKDTIRVFNIHLQSIRFVERNYSFIDTLSLKYSNKQLAEFRDIGMRLRDAFVRRAEQSNIIYNYIQESPYPVIVVGDFNDTPVSYAYRKIQKGLFDAFRESGRGFGNTYAGDLPSYRIDFILYSKPLESVKFTRLKSKYSDHYPISASFQWP